MVPESVTKKRFQKRAGQKAFPKNRVRIPGLKKACSKTRLEKMVEKRGFSEPFFCFLSCGTAGLGQTGPLAVISEGRGVRKKDDPPGSRI